MTSNTVIALDAMGGDHAPEIVFAGAALALERSPKTRYLFFGNEPQIKPIFDRYPTLLPVSELRHTPDAIAADAKPSIALRQGRQSSMRLAINAVAQGEAGGIVSAGNTGALLAIAKFVLKTLPGIDRPAIVTFIPTMTGESVMLDLGVNVECDAENLVQFALMGAIFCRVALGISQPSIGLLNIGTEEMKGHDEVRAAANILRERTSFPGKFYGFVEGNDLSLGTVDVVVTDGFSGNIALKTLEGTAQLITWFMKQAYASSLMARIGYIFARGAMNKLKLRTDPRRYNGGMLLGLQGVCVKSHGGTDREGFASAIGVARDLMDSRFNEQISEEIARQYGSLNGLGDSEAEKAPEPASAT